MAEGRCGSRWTSEAVDAGMSRWKQARDEEVYAPRAVELAIEAALAVFPVGEPDDERLIARVGEAIEGASPIHLEAASPGWTDDVARAAVAAVRATGEKAE